MKIEIISCLMLREGSGGVDYNTVNKGLLTEQLRKSCFRLFPGSSRALVFLEELIEMDN